MKTRDFYPSKWRLALHYFNIAFDYIWLVVGSIVFISMCNSLDKLIIFFFVNLAALVIRFVLTKLDMDYYLSQYKLFESLSE